MLLYIAIYLITDYIQCIRRPNIDRVGNGLKVVYIIPLTKRLIVLSSLGLKSYLLFRYPQLNSINSSSDFGFLS